MSDENELRNTVKGMAALVLNSNRISEVHEKNMKLYPFIFFEGVTAVEIDYDLSHEANVDVDKENNVSVKSPLRNCYVAYNLTLDESKNSNTRKRYEALEQSTRTLFWKDLTVKISFNGKQVYESGE